MMEEYELESKEREQAEKREKKEKRLLKQRKNDLKTILDTPGGRRFIWNLLSDCGLFQTSYATHSNQMAFNEGQRNVALRLQVEVMEARPDAFGQMMQESKKEELKDE